jgi:hypothetical protein
LLDIAGGYSPQTGYNNSKAICVFARPYALTQACRILEEDVRHAFWNNHFKSFANNRHISEGEKTQAICRTRLRV